jgi:PhnB protein
MPEREARGLIPHLTVKDAAKAIDFYKTAFGAVEVARMPEAKGTRLMFAELKLGNSSLFLNDDFQRTTATDTAAVV